MPDIACILNAALERFNLHEERTDLRKAFLDIVLYGKTPEEVTKGILAGLYKL